MERILEIPLLDEIVINKWFSAKYNIGQLEECKNLLEQHIWITARREQMYVRNMTTSHIQNCIRCWNGQGKLKIPTGYLGGKEKWLKIFTQELLNRQ